VPESDVGDVAAPLFSVGLDPWVEGSCKRTWRTVWSADTLPLGMSTNGFQFIGLGLYTVPEASRLSHVSMGRIRRWLRGYTFTTKSGPHKSPPVVASALPPLDGAVTLTFLDLQEVRFVDAFLEAGVHWKTIREARDRARHILGAYPFSRGRLVTDGRSIFQDLARGSGRSDAALVDLVSGQGSFSRVVRSFIATLKFAGDGQADEWWPLGKHRLVLLSPHRCFGQPIVPREGVPTAILAKAAAAEQSVHQVARWFEVSERAVRDAVEFETSLAA
jgi:uncharacterized protein (DUF433 family)